MKKLIYFTITALISGVANAGLISHTDYSAGAVITAAAQNTNENAIINEFNGNISAANLAADSVTTAKILDGTILNADLNSTLQSTVTMVNSFGNYRRPILKAIDQTTVDVENNTGTANETCIFFPDGRRCVTENTGSTSVNRRFIITEAASNSGTKNSGLIGATEASNTWYSIYGWKVSDNSTDFVLVGTTVNPVQANYSTLNTMFGTNAWVYLGVIRNGDNGSTAADILDFTMNGNTTEFNNTVSGGASARPGPGVILSSAASSASTSYTFTSGLTGNSIPGNLTLVYYYTATSGGSSRSIFIKNVNAAKWRAAVGADSQYVGTAGPVPVGSGSLITMGGAGDNDILLSGFIDSVLGIGYNPQL